MTKTHYACNNQCTHHSCWLTDIHTCTQCNQNVCSHTDKSADVFGIFLLFYALQFQVEHNDVCSLKVNISNLCSYRYVSVLKTFVCTVEIQGCVSEIQFPFMQFEFLLIVGAFCTLTRKKSDNCIPLEHAVIKFTLNTALHFSLCLINNTPDIEEWIKEISVLSSLCLYCALHCMLI